MPRSPDAVPDAVRVVRQRDDGVAAVLVGAVDVGTGLVGVRLAGALFAGALLVGALLVGIVVGAVPAVRTFEPSACRDSRGITTAGGGVNMTPSSSTSNSALGNHASSGSTFRRYWRRGKA